MSVNDGGSRRSAPARSALLVCASQGREVGVLADLRSGLVPVDSRIRKAVMSFDGVDDRSV